MKFLMTYKGNDRDPSPEDMQAIGKFCQEMAQSGVLLMTGGLVRPNNGIQLKYAGGKHSVTDGPFPETKELIDGFALIQVDSRQRAVELAQQFMSVAGEGEGEILQVFDIRDGAVP